MNTDALVHTGKKKSRVHSKISEHLKNHGKWAKWELKKIFFCRN